MLLLKHNTQLSKTNSQAINNFTDTIIKPLLMQLIM